jgi:hypothetical protein
MSNQINALTRLLQHIASETRCLRRDLDEVARHLPCADRQRLVAELAAIELQSAELLGDVRGSAADH